MEFVRSGREKSSFFSNAIYVSLNIGLAVAVFYLVNLFPGVPSIAYLLIVLSKWRVIAVRPRFWWDNFQSNLLDMMLGLSVVTLLWQARGALFIQIAVTILYGLWLVVLKPMNKRLAVLAQALIAQFFAITAVFSVAITWPSWLVAAAMWVIGFVSIRHALTLFEERDTTMLSLIWGLLVAELGWLTYHWTIAYSIVTTGGAVKIPQVAIVITLLSYFTLQLYIVYYDKKVISRGEIIWPAVFVGSIILMMLLFFNGVDPSSP